MSQALEQLRRAGLNHSLFRRRLDLRGRRSRSYRLARGRHRRRDDRLHCLGVLVCVVDVLYPRHGGQELLKLMMRLWGLRLLRGEGMCCSRENGLRYDGLAKAASQTGVVVHLIQVVHVPVVLLVVVDAGLQGGQIEPVLAQVCGLCAVAKCTCNVLVGIHHRMDVVWSAHVRFYAVAMSMTSHNKANIFVAFKATSI